MTKVELEIASDTEMYLFFDKGTSGRVSQEVSKIFLMVMLKNWSLTFFDKEIDILHYEN